MQSLRVIISTYIYFIVSIVKNVQDHLKNNVHLVYSKYFHKGIANYVRILKVYILNRVNVYQNVEMVS